MRGRSAVSTDLDGLYAAQRLTMVRLAVLLVGDRDVAESVVQRAFLVLVRRHDRRGDPGTAVAELRSQVVAECRAVLRGRRDESVLPRRSGTPRTTCSGSRLGSARWSSSTCGPG